MICHAERASAEHASGHRLAAPRSRCWATRSPRGRARGRSARSPVREGELGRAPSGSLFRSGRPLRLAVERRCPARPDRSQPRGAASLWGGLSRSVARSKRNSIGRGLAREMPQPRSARDLGRTFRARRAVRATLVEATVRHRTRPWG